MLYVGLTENHKESATMFANVVGAQAISQFTGSRSNGDHAAKGNSGQFRSYLFTGLMPWLEILMFHKVST